MGLPTADGYFWRFGRQENRRLGIDLQARHRYAFAVRCPLNYASNWCKQKAHVYAHDPVVKEISGELKDQITLCSSPLEAMLDADALVIATEWPEYLDIVPEMMMQKMKNTHRFGRQSLFWEAIKQSASNPVLLRRKVIMNPISLAGQTAIITGASRGLGLAIAKAFISAGANIVISGRKTNRHLTLQKSKLNPKSAPAKSS